MYFSVIRKLMHDDLEICVNYNSKEQCFPVEFNRIGYTYRFTVLIHDIPVIFEPDEERQWRARAETTQPISKEVTALIPLVAEQLTTLLG